MEVEKCPTERPGWMWLCRILMHQRRERGCQVEKQSEERPIRRREGGQDQGQRKEGWWTPPGANLPPPLESPKEQQPRCEIP